LLKVLEVDLSDLWNSKARFGVSREMRFLVLGLGLTLTASAAIASAQSDAVREWRDLRTGVASVSELIQLPEVRKSVGLTSGQMHRIAGMHQKAGLWTREGRDDFSNGWTMYSEQRRLGAMILTILPSKQVVRLREFQYQVLGATALLEPDLRRRLQLRKGQISRMAAIEETYARPNAEVARGPIMGDLPPRSEQADPRKRRAMEEKLVGVLSSRQKILYKRARGRILPSLRALAERTG
jgi:hypothetical protein